MSGSAMIALLFSIIIVATLEHASGLTETSQILSLLENVNGTSNTIASILPHMASSIRNQEAQQNETTQILDQMAKDREADKNQTAMIFSQLANTQNQMANAQAELTSALNQVVHMLQDLNTCYSSPCQNQGQCVRSLNSYTCKCQSGWTGDNCEINIDECSSAPCHNEGQCIDGVNNYTCQCLGGWTGNLCETNIDECSSAPCQNDGLCTDGVNQYMCQCNAGWTGASCEINMDECSSAPCQNAGQCMDGVNNYTCQCLDGWTGILCESNIDECASGPCLNEGLCTDGVNLFTCQCVNQYTGYLCEISPTCQPGNFLCEDGNCIPNGWVCDRFPDCPSGIDEDDATCATCPYTFLCTNGRCVDLEEVCDGTNNCQDNSDEDQICVDMASPSVTTLNETFVTLQWNEPPPELTGTPRRNITQYVVTFTSQIGRESHEVFVPVEKDAAYTVTGLTPATTYEIKVDVIIDTEGQGELMYNIWVPMFTVTTDIDECSSFPCQHGGQCTDGVSQYICQCIAGWTGASCELNIDECSSAPCQNEGQCIDGINNFTCQCLAGWTGNLCEIDIDECASDPCLNEGLCTDGVNQFTCQCVKQYTGHFCEISPTCQPGDFLCDDGSCIPNDLVCDRFADCDNGTDEDETICATCPYMFLCTNGRCTNLENVCDGTNNCRDNSDEDQICVDMAAPSVTGFNKTSVTLQWNEPPPGLTGTPRRNITQYAVTFTSQDGGELHEVFVPAEEDAVYTVTGLKPATTYTIEVNVGIDTEGQSEQMYNMGIPVLTVATHVDECSNAPCQNGGQCTDGVNKYTCRCIAGWTGTSCENNIDECASVQCQNSGQCIDGVNNYTCQCLGGWTGNLCEINIDECSSAPCQNAGLCIDGINNYTCQCVRGYTGYFCENNPTCQPGNFLCDNGRCIPNDWVCDTYPDCESGTDEEETTCASCPYKFLCQNGKCVNLENVCDGTNHCQDNSDEDEICVDLSSPSVVRLSKTSITLQWNEPTPELSGYAQRNITQYVVTATPQGGGESNIVYVPVEAGQNNVSCIITDLKPDTTYNIDGFVTISTEGQLESDQMYEEIGMSRITATTHVNACVSGPCQNGGQCADDVGNFTCQCVRGYTGRLCENNPTCQPDDFLCDDGSCIPDIYQCDGFADCNDGTDEAEATCAACPFRFLCTNGRCTDVRKVCDGTNDCEDNSDEEICVDISPTASVVGTSITLQWNALLEMTGNPRRNITQYIVTVTPRGDGDSQVVLVTAEDNATYTVTGLEWATTYEIEVDVVIDTDGQGEQMYDIGIPAIKVNTSVPCVEYLGMQNGDIPDGNIQASSYVNRYYYPWYARLHGGNYWLVSSTYINPWIQADIGYQIAVYGVVTQGAQWDIWVTSFRVSTFSMTTSDLETFIPDVGGSIKVFPGNYDGQSEVTSAFPEPVYARIVRITCLEKYGTYWGMKFEILGCKLN